MRSTFAGLNTAVRGLNSQQASLDTMGHNISNVNTEGYSRQNAHLVTMPSQSYGGKYGKTQIGAGSSVASITRARDSFIDRQYWKENSAYKYGDTVLSGLSNIEQVFQEPTDTGIQTVMNKFWQSWQSLSVNAADYSCRTNVKSCGTNLVNAVQQAVTQLKNNISDANSLLNLKVQSTNELSSEIASLNEQIFYLEYNGDHANDLRDRRDLLVNKMSDLASITVVETEKGYYNISIDGNQVVSETSYKNIVVKDRKDEDYGYLVNDLYIEGTESKLNITKGEIGGLVTSRDDEKVGYKGFLNQLSRISQYFLTDFNSVHRAGLGTDDTTNNNFFGAMKTGGNTDYDYKNDPEYRLLSYSKGDWINELCVNPALMTTDGLNKIAAKTSMNSDIYVRASEPVITTSGNYIGGAYTGIHIEQKVDAGGAISYVAKSADNVKEWPVTLLNGKMVFTVAGMQITSELNGSAYNSYKYNISNDGKVTATDPNGNSLQNSRVVVSTEGTYTGGNETTMLKIEKKTDGKYYYSINDGTQVEATVVGGKIQFSNIEGLNVSVDVNSAQAVGTYSIPISHSNNASGDNAVNLANFMKSGAVKIFGDTSLETYYASMIADLGVQTQNTDRLTANQETLVSQVINWREQVSGVNIDEEMSDMIRFQRAYGASARVITTMDEMLDKLINSTGTVGR